MREERECIRETEREGQKKRDTKTGRENERGSDAKKRERDRNRRKKIDAEIEEENERGSYAESEGRETYRGK